MGYEYWSRNCRGVIAYPLGAQGCFALHSSAITTYNGDTKNEQQPKTGTSYCRVKSNTPPTRRRRREPGPDQDLGRVEAAPVGW